MKSTKNKRAITVGIFIFLGLLIFVVGVLTLGGQHKTFEKSLNISAVFDDVGGLQAGNNIWFSGVKIGTVKKISLYGNAKVQVDMSVEQQSRRFIHKDAKAKIGSDGLIGNKIIVIYGGSPQVAAVTQGDVLKVESSMSMDDMMDTLQKNNRNILSITDNFKNISSKIAEGQGTLGKLLTDESLMQSLQSTIAILKKASLNTERLTNTFSVYASKLNNKGTLANNLVTDTVVFSNIRSTMAQLQQAANTATEITNNLKTATNDINTTNGPIGTLLHDKQAAANLKSTLSNLQSGTKKLDDNMEALQHNFLLRGFFRKKAKQQASVMPPDSSNTGAIQQ